ncbi:hypothetical protein ACFVOK_11455 [Streptomyces sp. NPDC057798]|uniref:hypothetical protein n=1 Tax=Streptomyces sp. NPDC057798 TaxID=3346252 RepID=UPI003686FF3C
MTWPAALSGAAVRMPRTVAGRRALYLALLVGGLFAFGLLGGQRAQAAEDAPTALSADVRTAVEGVTGSVAREPGADDGSGQEDGAEKTHGRELPSLTGDIVPAVTERVVRPERAVRPVGEVVGEVVGAVTDGLEEGRGAVPPLGSLPERPELPALPEPPALPELPESPEPGLPVFPGLPGLPALPVQTLPAATPQPTPVTSASADEADSAGTSADEADSAGTSVEDAVTATPHSVTPYDTTAIAPAHRTSAHPRHHRADTIAPAPARHAPAGDPGGAPDHRATVDNGTPRHGDAHAVTAHHLAPLRLVPGAAAHVGADEIRDAYRDIPVSPA